MPGQVRSNLVFRDVACGECSVDFKSPKRIPCDDGIIRCKICMKRRRQKIYWTRNRAKQMPLKKKSWYMKKYGISQEDFFLLLDIQHNACAICATPWKEDLKIKFAVDHCHNTNRIRGVLCGNCNTGLGQLKEDPMNLISAIRYLTNESPIHIKNGAINRDPIGA